MINVTIGESKTQSEDYPKVMISSLATTNTDTIVLFVSEGCGTCLKKGKGETSNVGEYSEHWRMGVFEPLPNSITLQNA